MKKLDYRFDRVPYLSLLDLKAQKKNISCKKFMNIPLTFEEKIASKIANQSVEEGSKTPSCSSKKNIKILTRHIK